MSSRLQFSCACKTSEKSPDGPLCLADEMLRNNDCVMCPVWMLCSCWSLYLNLALYLFCTAIIIIFGTHSAVALPSPSPTHISCRPLVSPESFAGAIARPLTYYLMCSFCTNTSLCCETTDCEESLRDVIMLDKQAQPNMTSNDNCMTVSSRDVTSGDNEPTNTPTQQYEIRCKLLDWPILPIHM